jgi:hypothetical protein
MVTHRKNLWRANTSSVLDVDVVGPPNRQKGGWSGFLDTCSDDAGDQLQR